MRRFSIIGGLLLALAAATSTMAASPQAIAIRTAPAPTVVTTTLRWHATFTKATITGTAKLNGPSTYASDKVAISATGIKKGATITVRLLDRHLTHVTAFATMTFTASLNSKGAEARTWVLTAAQRAALKADVKAGDKLYFRLVDGSVLATGRLLVG
jgi:hypothetical protein